MADQSIDQFESETHQIFIHNFKNFIKKEHLTQKQLAMKIGVLDSTISNCNHKLPSLDFLLKLKRCFPDISLDTFLFGEISPESSFEIYPETSFSIESLEKFFGIYYLYYVDTSKKISSKEQDSTDFMLKTGLLYVYHDPLIGNVEKATCLAVFGLKRRDEAEEIREKIAQFQSLSGVLDFVRFSYPYNLYTGTFSLSQTHIFISLKQDHDNKDNSLIVLHRPELKKPQYIGGLGTINSASSGRPSDPVVQLIGLSREKLYLTDEEVKKLLQFSPPNINFNDEAAEILTLVQKLYEKKSTLPDKHTSENDTVVLQKYLPDIIESRLGLLLTKNIESNVLCYGKVHNTMDNAWYHALNNSAEKRKKEDTEYEENIW
ncbi:MAG: helix-turn-helix transcriptional regulator [Lachnospiraceae bacterium]|nr:helix-turn-helix transcriptional regulator [Lachnospiraceae bacterium]